MERKTVSVTVEAGLCCGCGVCLGVCPTDSLSWSRRDGMYIPQIDAQTCVLCGLCASVCPGLKHSYETAETAAQTVTGPVLYCSNAWSLDPELRHVSASGGVVSAMIRELLARGLYDGAFCLDSYDYREQLKTRLYTAKDAAEYWEQSRMPKSRYLPVSHENAAAYMKVHRNARLILVGTSCAVRGLQAAVRELRLNRENYLFVGLFCDQVFNYNVLSYFEDAYSPAAPLEALHFKNKDSGGWPGDMKLFPKGGEPFFRPHKDRSKAKAYFMPERCLYCVDKLNSCADISLGDNYTGKNDSKLGSNSVIVRTRAGENAWEATKDKLERCSVDIGDIQRAQALEWRINNLYFGELKAEDLGRGWDLNAGVPRENEAVQFARAMKTAQKRLQTGAKYNSDSSTLWRQMQKDSQKPNAVVQFLRRCYGFAKRKMKRGLR